jgi:hypothetical protein
MKYRHILILIIAVFCPLTLHAGSPGPSTYEECILDSMKGVTSDAAANAIIDSCKHMFPGKKPTSEIAQGQDSGVVPSSVLEKLSGMAGVKRNTSNRTPPKFSGTIFNESQWVITDITVTIFPIEEVMSAKEVIPLTEEKMKELAQSCTSELNSYVWPIRGSTFETRPLTEAKFNCPEVYTPDGMNYHWFINSAKGFRA